MQPVLELENVGVVYRSRLGLRARDQCWALRDVNLTLNRGETLGIIGANGAGKSTLLKVLADIINPDAGSVRRHTRSLMLLSLRVGFMTHLTGRENAILSGMLLGMRRRELEQLMPGIIEYAELEHAIDHPVRTYSAGMRARLGFAVACQAVPDVLLVDEALGVGDVAFRKKSTATMEAMIRSEKTVVIVSHQEETIRRLCSRVLWLDRGTVRECDKADKVLGDYEGAGAKASAPS